VRSHDWAGVDISPYPKLSAWLDRIHARPGADAGLGVPERGRKLTKEEEQKKAEEARAWIFLGSK
jgi:glutathione S-transferase